MALLAIDHIFGVDTKNMICNEEAPKKHITNTINTIKNTKISFIKHQN